MVQTASVTVFTLSGDRVLKEKVTTQEDLFRLARDVHRAHPNHCLGLFLRDAAGKITDDWCWYPEVDYWS